MVAFFLGQLILIQVRVWNGRRNVLNCIGQKCKQRKCQLFFHQNPSIYGWNVISEHQYTSWDLLFWFSRNVMWWKEEVIVKYQSVLNFGGHIVYKILATVSVKSTEGALSENFVKKIYFAFVNILGTTTNITKKKKKSFQSQHENQGVLVICYLFSLRKRSRLFFRPLLKELFVTRTTLFQRP